MQNNSKDSYQDNDKVENLEKTHAPGLVISIPSLTEESKFDNLGIILTKMFTSFYIFTINRNYK